MINKFIIKTLKPCGIPIYFVTRGENKKECIVFNVLETPGEFSDNREELTEYTILLNIYVKSNRYVEFVENIKETMAAAGFIKKVVPTAQWNDELEMFNQPIE